MTAVNDAVALQMTDTVMYMLPELLLVVVRRGGEGGWNIHSFGSLCDGPG